MTVYLLDNVEPIFGISEREFLMIVDFAFHELKIPNKVDILFSFEQIEDYVGFCHNYECDDDEYQVIISPLIETWEELVKTIFHEMTHVKQYCFNELSGDVWHGTPCSVYDMEYHQLPWEAEAFKNETVLYSKYVLEDTF